jgi:peroxiredoxin
MKAKGRDQPMAFVHTNKKAPEFALLDQSEQLISLDKLKKHRYAVLYFYSKDDTSG